MKNVVIMVLCFGVVFMKKLEFYLFRVVLVIILVVIVVLFFVVVVYFFDGFVIRMM